MIIGITGTIGAGKGAVVECLKEKGFQHVSARLIWTKELEARGLPVDRDHMTVLANQLRAEHGADYFVRQALASVEKTEQVIIESIRTVAEAKLLKEAGGILLTVDAEQSLRYERVSGRGSKLDDISFDDFVRQERTEMENEDPAKQNIAKVMKMSDYIIMNDGSLEELQVKIEDFLNTVHD